MGVARMRLLILIFCAMLAACEATTVDVVVPDALLQPVPIPSRVLRTYRDAVVRDAERGAALIEANEKLKSIAVIVAPK